VDVNNYYQGKAAVVFKVSDFGLRAQRLEDGETTELLAVEITAQSNQEQINQLLLDFTQDDRVKEVIDGVMVAIIATAKQSQFVELDSILSEIDIYDMPGISARCKTTELVHMTLCGYLNFFLLSRYKTLYFIKDALQD
jgi:hypothetical protein